MIPDSHRKTLQDTHRGELTQNDIDNHDKFVNTTIDEFNNIFTVHEILIRNGYQPVLNSGNLNASIPFKRYKSLFGSIVNVDNCSISGLKKNFENFQALDDYTFYYNYKYKPENAFDCYLILECECNLRKALKWKVETKNNLEYIKQQDFRRLDEINKKYNLADKRAVTPQPRPEPYTYIEIHKPLIDGILDSTAPYLSTDLTRYIHKNHIINRLTAHISYECDLPRSTVFLIGLGVFSGMTCRKWVVEYPDGGKLPTCLYVVAEQPSGTSKTRALSSFQKPFVDIIKKRITELEADIQLAEPIKDNKTNDSVLQSQAEELSRLHNLMPTTNTTPEALEISLIESKGFFSAVSSEQGLFNSLLGVSYGGKKGNNNDILLNGRDAGFVKVGRAGRASYSGHVTGNIVCFAQEGSIEKVIDASNGTGVSERFLMIAEQHLLGTRDHSKKIPDNKELLDEYAKKCQFITELAKKQPEHDNLISLRIFEDDWSQINNFRNQIEPFLTDGYDLSHNVLRGAVNKVTMQIMGIAANLHILGDGDEGFIYPVHIESAINIVSDLVRAMFFLCVKKGLVGKNNEIKTILNMYVGKDRGFTDQEIKKYCREKNPFKNYQDKSVAIQNTLNEMIRLGMLILRDDNYYLDGKI